MLICFNKWLLGAIPKVMYKADITDIIFKQKNLFIYFFLTLHFSKNIKKQKHLMRSIYMNLQTVKQQH